MSALRVTVALSTLPLTSTVAVLLAVEKSSLGVKPEMAGAVTPSFTMCASEGELSLAAEVLPLGMSSALTS